MEIETKYLHKETSRYGKVYHFFRKRPYKRIRLKGEPGTPEFMKEYLDALTACCDPVNPAPLQVKTKAEAGSLRSAIEIYYMSPEFKRLDERTQTVRRQILDRTCEDRLSADKPPFGEWPIARMTAGHIRRMRDLHSDRPEAANGIVKALRQVFAYAIEAEFKDVKFNPARDVPYFTGDGEGHHTWELEEVQRYEDRHPVGTMAHLALALLLYLGQRRSDVVEFGPGMVKDGWLHFTQVKNRKRKPVKMALPVIPELQRIIDATPGTGSTYMVNGLGGPFTANGFGNWFADRCVEAGVPGRAHGLRKAASARLAELGCSEREIMAITGHKTSKEVDRYTKAARQKVLAKSAMEKLTASMGG